MAAVPERHEMRVPLVRKRKSEILQVTMIRGTDDQVSAGPKHLLRETNQVTRSNQVLNYFGSDGHIKGLVANLRRIVIYCDLVKNQLGRRAPGETNPIRARLATNHLVSSAGQLAA